MTKQPSPLGSNQPEPGFIFRARMPTTPAETSTLTEHEVEEVLEDEPELEGIAPLRTTRKGKEKAQSSKTNP